MQMYSANVEVALRDCEDLSAVLAQLEHHHAALGQSERGWLQALISLPAESLTQATATAVTLVSAAYGAEPVACHVMTEAEFDAREGWAPAPSEMLSVTEAAELLGVSRQAVLQRIDGHRLQAVKIGRSWAIPRTAVEERQDSQ